MTKTNETSMPVLHLSNGVDMPAAGFGVYKVSPLLAKDTVKQALETGWRLIDTRRRTAMRRRSVRRSARADFAARTYS